MLPDLMAAWFLILMSALASMVSMLVVWEKSTVTFLARVAEACGGESVTMMPPGPLGTLKKDRPRNRMDVGMPVTQDLLSSS